ncbi:prepilin-type N-terminal cleavage/methylation domain-containing protein [Pseudoruegeria sp. SHC-113]|uniref:prepilin-type N-terminal cleavage/methylation domain-containing protein n=1 Tax=Pseudoruegeria sp. SHC-113 TaxID=2855439 RepID=UPI0021BB743E|nr:prepilin-type N-terminal cleavage/methylation domain-containing protein [Pseudoruegeria sp. SHC-113]MCT8161674.1 prepilin-type N-terminal cleavage/methylation domain-containing protein [Pseudoruegeria sp. SHC-113]
MVRAVTPLKAPEGRTGGFTLLELLVVVAVMALLSVGATLALGARGAAFPRDVARLEAQVRQATQQAVLWQTPYRLRVQAEGLSLERGGAASAQGVNTPVARWESGRLRLLPNGAPLRTEALFLPSGASEALLFSLATANGARADCSGDGWGGFACQLR